MVSNNIIINGQKVDFSLYKKKAEQSDYAQNKALNSIFEALNKADKNGEKDNILDEKEIANFQEKLLAAAGDDGELSDEEARGLLDSMGLQEVETSELFEFAKSLTEKIKDGVDAVVGGNQNAIDSENDENTALGEIFGKIKNIDVSGMVNKAKSAGSSIVDKFKSATDTLMEKAHDFLEAECFEAPVNKSDDFVADNSDFVFAESPITSDEQILDTFDTETDISGDDIEDVDDPDNDDELEKDVDGSEEKEDDIVRVEEAIEDQDVQDSEDIDDADDDNDDDDSDKFDELDEIKDDIVRVEQKIEDQDVQDDEKP